jgi:hypothetical protein
MPRSLRARPRPLAAAALLLTALTAGVSAAGVGLLHKAAGSAHGAGEWPAAAARSLSVFSTTPSVCRRCYPGTRGACQAPNSVCYDFVTGTTLCPSGSHACECPCVGGSDGPCHTAEGVCSGYVNAGWRCSRTTFQCFVDNTPVPAPRVCSPCVGGTAGPCQHAASGRCLPYAPLAFGGPLCPLGTQECEAFAGPTLSGAGLCSGCSVGTSGPCRAASGACVDFYEDTAVCPRGTAACGLAPNAATLSASLPLTNASVDIVAADTDDTYTALVAVHPLPSSAAAGAAATTPPPQGAPGVGSLTPSPTRTPSRTPSPSPAPGNGAPGALELHSQPCAAAARGGVPGLCLPLVLQVPAASTGGVPVDVLLALPGRLAVVQPSNVTYILTRLSALAPGGNPAVTGCETQTLSRVPLYVRARNCAPGTYVVHGRAGLAPAPDGPAPPDSRLAGACSRQASPAPPSRRVSPPPTPPVHPPPTVTNPRPAPCGHSAHTPVCTPGLCVPRTTPPPLLSHTPTATHSYAPRPPPPPTQMGCCTVTPRRVQRQRRRRPRRREDRPGGPPVRRAAGCRGGGGGAAHPSPARQPRGADPHHVLRAHAAAHAAASRRGAIRAGGSSGAAPGGHARARASAGAQRAPEAVQPARGQARGARPQRHHPHRQGPSRCG